MKRRRRLWSWDRIVRHKKLCREYRDLYKSKRLGDLSSDQTDDLEVDMQSITTGLYSRVVMRRRRLSFFRGATRLSILIYENLR